LRRGWKKKVLLELSLRELKSQKKLKEMWRDRCKNDKFPEGSLANKPLDYFIRLENLLKIEKNH
jgi:hypothetical protein